MKLRVFEVVYTVLVERCVEVTMKYDTDEEPSEEEILEFLQAGKYTENECTDDGNTIDIQSIDAQD